MHCMDATDLNIAQLTVNLKATSVTSTVTVVMTVMKTDVVRCNKWNHDIFIHK